MYGFRKWLERWSEKLANKIEQFYIFFERSDSITHTDIQIRMQNTTGKLNGIADILLVHRFTDVRDFFLLLIIWDHKNALSQLSFFLNESPPPPNRNYDSYPAQKMWAFDSLSELNHDHFPFSVRRIFSKFANFKAAHKSKKCNASSKQRLKML